MNLMSAGMKLDPATTKLVHCKNCDTTFADKRIPKYCPVCGADKKKMAGASADECESFMETYQEAMQHDLNLLRAMHSNDDSGLQEADNLPVASEESTVTVDPDSTFERLGSDYATDTDEEDPSYDSFDPAYKDTDFGEEDLFEPIGYDPDELMAGMPASKKISKYETNNLLTAAEGSIREKKYAMQRAGLNTDGLYSISQDIRQKADTLGRNIPEYTRVMLMMYVDHSLQATLRHPENNRTYSQTEIEQMLQELEIRPACWDSYYEIAGIR